jgi:hypothetical protein
MYLYYFLMKRFRNSYLQARGNFLFFFMLLMALIVTVIVRSISSMAFHSLLFLTGWYCWTFTEYILHRFYMHDKNPGSTLAKTHHHHHTHPTELMITNVHRIAMAFVLAALAVVAFLLNGYFTFVTGFCFGIEGYFIMHRILHLKVSQRLFKKLVRYHIYHHCKYPNTCFGISVPWWDDIFKTVPNNPKISQRIIDFYFSDTPNPPFHEIPSQAAQ